MYGVGDRGLARLQEFLDFSFHLPVRAVGFGHSLKLRPLILFPANMKDFSKFLTTQPSLFADGIRIDLNCRGLLGRGSG